MVDFIALKVYIKMSGTQLKSEFHLKYLQFGAVRCRKAQGSPKPPALAQLCEYCIYVVALGNLNFTKRSSVLF
jgi:hypothetical protein